MNIRLLFRGVVALLFFLLIGCERPGSPDFEIEHKIQAPLILEKEYTFLGGKDALIDTTSEEYDSLFTSDADGLVSLSQELEIDVAELDNIVPAVNAGPATAGTTVGEIRLGDFASGDEAGSATFGDITGSPATLDEGDPVPPGGQTPAPVKIDLDTEYFERALLKSGSIAFSLANDLGFHLERLDITLLSGSAEEEVGTTSIVSFDDNTTETAMITPDYSAGEAEISDLKVEVEAEWDETGEMQRDSGKLIIVGVGGDNLIASEVKAAVPPQQFRTSGSVSFTQDEFRFENAEHYVQLASGELKLTDLINEIDLDIEPFTITFPDIRSEPYGQQDQLSVDLSIPRSSSGAVQEQVDLSGYRIYAENGELSYEIEGQTNDTRQSSGSSSSIRTVNENDRVEATLELDNLNVDRAFGVVARREMLLNEDAPSNGIGTLELFENEAEVIEIDGLSSFSEKLDGIEFLNPTLTIDYTTNLGIASDIFTSIVGVKADGTAVFLHGKEGEAPYVEPADIPEELEAAGTKLTDEQIVSFALPALDDNSGSESGEGSMEFNRENSNAGQFINNLPEKIRFIGVADINPGEREGVISTPVEFDPVMRLEVPINLTADNASLRDTTEADLSDLPDGEGERRLSEAQLAVGYDNGLPFSLDFTLIFLDEDGEEVTRSPLETEEPMEIGAAGVDEDTRFSSENNNGEAVLTLESEQLSELHRVREIVFEIEVNSTNRDEVKVRDSDTIGLSLKMNVGIESSVN